MSAEAVRARLERMETLREEGMDMINAHTFAHHAESASEPPPSHGLLDAAERGNLARVQELLSEDGCNINVQNEFGYTALMLACDFGHTDVAMALLDHASVDLNIRNHYGETALYCAAVNDRSRIAKHLLSKPSILVNGQDTQSQFRWTALHAACKRGSYECVQLLLEHPETNAHIFDAGGHTAVELVPETHPHIHDAILDFAKQRESLSESELQLMWAARKGDTMEVKRLVKEKGVDVNTRFALQRTSLHLACKYNHREVVEQLTNHPQIEINARDQHSWTALHWASQDHDRNLPVVKLLMDHRDTDIHATNTDNQKAVDLAHQDSPVADHILSNGGGDKAATAHCRTHRFLRAAQNGNLDEIKEMMRTKLVTDLTVTFKNGQTALHLACRHGHLKMVKYFVEETSLRHHLDLQDKHGRTPLLEASRWPGNVPMALYLVEKMTPDEIHMTDVNGNTPLQVALLSHNMEVAEILISHDAAGIDPRKYLHWAAQVGHVEAVDLLTHHANIQVLDGSPSKNRSFTRSLSHQLKRQLSGGTKFQFPSGWNWKSLSMDTNSSMVVKFSMFFTILLLSGSFFSSPTGGTQGISFRAYNNSNLAVTSSWLRPIDIQDIESSTGNTFDILSVSEGGHTEGDQVSELLSEHKILKAKVLLLEQVLEQMQARLNSQQTLCVEGEDLQLS